MRLPTVWQWRGHSAAPLGGRQGWRAAVSQARAACQVPGAPGVLPDMGGGRNGIRGPRGGGEAPVPPGIAQAGMATATRERTRCTFFFFSCEWGQAHAQPAGGQCRSRLRQPFRPRPSLGVAGAAGSAAPPKKACRSPLPSRAARRAGQARRGLGHNAGHRRRMRGASGAHQCQGRLDARSLVVGPCQAARFRLEWPLVEVGLPAPQGLLYAVPGDAVFFQE